MGSLTEFKPNELQLIQRTVAKDCNADEFRLFIHLCQSVRLDPRRRQVYAFVFGKNDKDQSKRQLTLVTSIGGYRTIADRTGNYRPDENEPKYHFVPWKIERDQALLDAREIKDLRERKKQQDLIDEIYPIDPLNPHGIEKCIVYVWKHVHSEWHKVAGEAFWSEHVPTKEGWDDVARQKNGKLFIDPKKTGWIKMPRLMIAKIAEAAALRKAWPDDFANFLVDEETDRESTRLDAIEAVALADEQDRLTKIGHGKDRAIMADFGDNIIERVPVGQFTDRALAFIKGNLGDVEAIQNWEIRNREPLREFWALKQGEAIEIKRAIEKAVTPQK